MHVPYIRIYWQSFSVKRLVRSRKKKSFMWLFPLSVLGIFLNNNQLKRVAIWVQQSSIQHEPWNFYILSITVWWGQALAADSNTPYVWFRIFSMLSLFFHRCTDERQSRLSCHKILSCILQQPYNDYQWISAENCHGQALPFQLSI